MAKKIKRPSIENLGHIFGKPDVERLGIFSEMPFMNGKGYVSPFPRMANVKGKNMLPGGPKIKTARPDCYFEKDFKRIFSKEALRGRGRKIPPSKYKNISSRAFIPAGETKWHSTPGDWHGTFQGKVEYFSRKAKPVGPYKSEGKNAITSPGKKGGFGYNDICLNPYPSHSNEKYRPKIKFKEYGKVLDGPMVVGMRGQDLFEINPFMEDPKAKKGPTYVPPVEKVGKVLPPGRMVPTGPAKWMGGCKAGCFDKYPEHSKEKYPTVPVKTKSKKLYGHYSPPSWGVKTLYTLSVVDENIRFRVNETNYKTSKPTFIKYLV